MKSNYSNSFFEKVFQQIENGSPEELRDTLSVLEGQANDTSLPMMHRFATRALVRKVLLSLGREQDASRYAEDAFKQCRLEYERKGLSDDGFAAYQRLATALHSKRKTEVANAAVVLNTWLSSADPSWEISIPVLELLVQAYEVLGADSAAEYARKKIAHEWSVRKP